MDEKLYLFGKHDEYILDERAFRHIIYGDFTTRPFVDKAGSKRTEEILAGGLHTYSGWTTFLGKHPEVVHLLDYDPQLSEEWYFARELQNGVITLKMPKKLFSKAAASITMMPDVHYKSGYLWKTLFPRAYSEADILSVIREALLNIDTDASEIAEAQSLIIGFARTMDPFTAIRIRIQLEGNKIRSAFPTWDQPSTGNNGKPYSHEYSIGFHIAESTVGTENCKNVRTHSCLFKRDSSFSFEELIKITPVFLLERVPPKYGEIQDAWHERRQEEIGQYVQTANDKDLRAIEVYLSDFCISKEPFFLQFNVYKEEEQLLNKYPGLKNVAAVMQNVCDCFYALFCDDNQKKGRRFLVMMQRFLAMCVVHAGGLNTLEARRMVQLLANCAADHHADDSLRLYLEALSSSPIRSAIYNEFNVNTFVKENNDDGLMVVGISGVKMAFTRKHFIEFIAATLGENYAASFSREERLEIANILAEENYPDRLVQDCLSYFRGADFDFLAETFQNVEEIFKTKLAADEDVLISMLRDYCRMLVAYRQRIVMENWQTHNVDPYQFDWGSEEFYALTKVRHMRMFVMIKHQMMLDKMLEFAKKIGYQKLEKRCISLLQAMPKERVPMPVLIPDHIPSWRSDPQFKGTPKGDFSFLKRDA